MSTVLPLLIVWFCLFIDTVQILMCTPILPLLPLSAGVVAGLFSICPLIALVADPLAGAACDMYSRKACLAVGVLVRLVAAAFFVLANSNLSLALLFTARACL